MFRKETVLAFLTGSISQAYAQETLAQEAQGTLRKLRPDCTTTGWDYRGVNIKTTENIATWEECLKECHESHSCNVAVWSQSRRNTCWLKVSPKLETFFSVLDLGVIAGEKRNCPAPKTEVPQTEVPQEAPPKEFLDCKLLRNDVCEDKKCVILYNKCDYFRCSLSDPSWYNWVIKDRAYFGYWGDRCEMEENNYCEWSKYNPKTDTCDEVECNWRKISETCPENQFEDYRIEEVKTYDGPKTVNRKCCKGRVTKKGKSCILPFKFLQDTFDDCKIPDGGGAAWCPTKPTKPIIGGDGGKYYDIDGENWGICK